MTTSSSEHVSPIEITSSGNNTQLGGGSSLLQTIKGLGIPRGLLLNVSKPTYLSSAARPTNYSSIDGNMLDSLFEKMSTPLFGKSSNDTIKDKDKAPIIAKDKVKVKAKPPRSGRRTTKRAPPSPRKIPAFLHKKRNTRRRNTPTKK